MSESTKATRATIQIGDLTVNGFMLPDGSYRMSQVHAAEAVGMRWYIIRKFLASERVKRLLGKEYEPEVVETDAGARRRGNLKFSVLPLDVVSAFWLDEYSAGNQQALALCMDLIAETLTRYFDNTFGVQRSEDEYNQLLQERNEALQTILGDLGDAYAEPDVFREQLSRLERQTFTFEVVTVDSTGKIVQREQKSAEYRSEVLAKGFVLAMV